MTLTCNKIVNIDNDWLKKGIAKVNIYIETLLNFGVFWCSRYWYTCICTLGGTCITNCTCLGPVWTGIKWCYRHAICWQRGGMIQRHNNEVGATMLTRAHNYIVSASWNSAKPKNHSKSNLDIWSEIFWVVILFSKAALLGSLSKHVLGGLWIPNFVGRGWR